MNSLDRERWKSQVLDEIFVAIASSETLSRILVFKGARVLNLQLKTARQSLDIDSNLTRDFVRCHPDRLEQRAILEREFDRAIRRHFERQEPVQFELAKVTVKPNPRNLHPRGWDAFDVTIQVKDLSRNVGYLPRLELDVAAPEELREAAIGSIQVGQHHVLAYTLQRIAGEKLRAFLSTLPSYRNKVSKPGEAVRAKDLYDISQIFRVYGMEQLEFWRAVGQEFRVACQSRYIDCLGLTTFQEQWEVTRQTYQQATIPRDVPFDEAEVTLQAIVELFEEDKVIPFVFPLPD